MNNSKRIWQPIIVGGGVGALIALGFLSGIDVAVWMSSVSSGLSAQLTKGYLLLF